MMRHVERIHKNETLVKKAVECMEGGDNKIDLLQHKGDYRHNIKVLKVGGHLIVWRRPALGAVVNISDYLPCEFCLVFITKSELWQHSKTCSLKESDKYCSIKRSKQLLYPNKYSTGASNELKNMVLDNMLQDEFEKWLFEDQFITTYETFNLA